MILKSEFLKSKMRPLTGEFVMIELVEIDEFEVKCWIQKYSTYGYLDNSKLKYKPSDKKLCITGQIKFVDLETGRIELRD